MINRFWHGICCGSVQPPRAGTADMTRIFNYPGFEEAILNSADDYEPYGFVEPRLAAVSADDHALRQATVQALDQRVIEAALLARFHPPGG